jgi:uncharacterized RDD family membrane protein YckC
MPESTVELRPAGVGRRLAALVYDSFLIFGLMVVPLFLLAAIVDHYTAAARPGNGAVIHNIPSIAPAPLLLLYEAAVIVIFYCYFWRRNGQTLGMQAWRLRLDSNSGGRPGLRQCLLRMLAGIPALLAAGLGYWWIWIDRERRSWHDRASGTRVVVLPKNKR